MITATTAASYMWRPGYSGRWREFRGKPQNSQPSLLVAENAMYSLRGQTAAVD